MTGSATCSPKIIPAAARFPKAPDGCASTQAWQDRRDYRVASAGINHVVFCCKGFGSHPVSGPRRLGETRVLAVKGGTAQEGCGLGSRWNARAKWHGGGSSVKLALFRTPTAPRRRICGARMLNSRSEPDLTLLTSP